MIVTWRDAENACARYLREAGSGGAQVTPAGADGGIDVIGEHVIAQVKFVTAKVGSTTVQQFAGATIRHPTQTRKVFFSSAGFTDPAIRLANKLASCCSSSASSRDQPCRRQFRESLVGSVGGR